MTEEQAEYRKWQYENILPKLKELGEIIATRQKHGNSCPNEIILADAVINYTTAMKHALTTPH